MVLPLKIVPAHAKDAQKVAVNSFSACQRRKRNALQQLCHIVAVSRDNMTDHVSKLLLTAVHCSAAYCFQQATDSHA